MESFSVFNVMVLLILILLVYKVEPRAQKIRIKYHSKDIDRIKKLVWEEKVKIAILEEDLVNNSSTSEILEILNLKIPSQMTGQSLLKFCK